MPSADWEPGAVEGEVAVPGSPRDRRGWRPCLTVGTQSGLTFLSPRLFRTVSVVLASLEIGDQLRIWLSRRPRRWFLLLCLRGIGHLSYPNSRFNAVSTAPVVKLTNANFSLRDFSSSFSVVSTSMTSKVSRTVSCVNASSAPA